MREDSETHAARNIEYAATLDVPHLDVLRPRPGQCVLVGGAPSISNYQEDIRILKFPRRNFVIAINWAHTWLINRGIVPDACVFFEIDVDPSGVLGELHPDVTYYVCSHCHPSTWEALRGFKTVLWHAKADPPEMTAAQAKYFPGEPLLSGGLTTLIRAIDLGRMLGYRNFELFGCDSSFHQEGPTHVAGYPLDGHEKAGALQRIPICPPGNDRVFWSTLYLAKQAMQFQQWCQVNHMTFLMQVHGDSLLRYLHEKDWPEQYSIGW